MLLHTGDGPNLLMSIPRDSLSRSPGTAPTKINAAYAYRRPKLLIRTIENNTGIRVDHYVEIGFGGFVDLVDAVGGIEICPTVAMEDKQANLDLEKGCQEADGPDRARLRPLPQDRHGPFGDLDRARAPARGGLGDRQRGDLAVDGPQPGALLPGEHGRRRRRPRSARARPVRAGAVRAGHDPRRRRRRPDLRRADPDLAVNWDPERSEQMFQLIIEDDTDEHRPKSLCTPTGLPR